MNELRFFIELLLWLGAGSGAQNGISQRTGENQPGDSRQQMCGECYLGSMPLGLGEAPPHEPRWSVVSTVRQLNEPKISHFDQLGCSRIGRKTARKSSTVK